jgi:hypothetical protein
MVASELVCGLCQTVIESAIAAKLSFDRSGPGAHWLLALLI